MANHPYAPHPRPKLPTLRHVAALSGLSQDTVRKVLMGKAKHSPNEERIRAVAAELGYVYRPCRLGGRVPVREGGDGR